MAGVLLLLLRLVLLLRPLLHGRRAVLKCGRLHLLRTHRPASAVVALHACSAMSLRTEP